MLLRTTLFVSCFFTSLAGTAKESVLPRIASLGELLAINSESRTPLSLAVEGTVWYWNSGSGRLILSSGGDACELQLRISPEPLYPGDRIRIEGTGTLSKIGATRELTRIAVIDNDGIHVDRQKSGSVELKAGLVPLLVDWFNAGGLEALSLEYEGPGFERRKIPDSDLFHSRPGSAPTEPAMENGLGYRLFPGRLWALPPSLPTQGDIRTGIISNIRIPLEIPALSRAVEFSGFLRIPVEGRYTFHLGSDDGSRLFIGTPSLRVVRTAGGALPEPDDLQVGQAIAEEKGYAWIEMEGRVTSVSHRPTELVLDLQAGAGTTRIILADTREWPGALYRNSRIRVVGVCRSDRSTDGYSSVVTMLVQTKRQIEILEVSAALWSTSERRNIGEYRQAGNNAGQGEIVHLSGIVTEAAPGVLTLSDGTGRVPVRLHGNQKIEVGAEVEILGVPLGHEERFEVEAASLRLLSSQRPEGVLPAQSLATIEQVHMLDKQQLLRGAPVRLSGVVTYSIPENKAVILHDSTRGIYVDMELFPASTFIGDHIEVEGIADSGEYSPFVRARRVTRHGMGHLPTAVYVTRDRLIDGSLHCQYAEIEGYVSKIDGETITLFMRSGEVKLQLQDCTQEIMKGMLHSIVRIRGTFFSRWDRSSRKINVGEAMLAGIFVSVETPPPADPFLVPAKRVSELLSFDPLANYFQRIKLSGQIIGCDGGNAVLLDGEEGARISLEEPCPLKEGDLVDASGFVDVSGPSPMLSPSLVRKTGHAPLPKPKALMAGQLLDEHHDSRLVSVIGILAGVTATPTGRILEIASGRQRFNAILKVSDDTFAIPAVGSMIELTGVYRGFGGNRVIGRPIDSFDINLVPDGGIRLISNPPWWTLKKLLIFVTVLALGLLLTLGWVSSLRAQVAERTKRLKKEIEDRQQAEQQKALALERARLAHDLHDDLGAGLTEVGLLGFLASAPAIPSDNRNQYLSQLTQIARGLVSVLDEIVWAVNPRYDSVASAPDYFGSYAQRFLELANIKCRFDIPESFPDAVLSSGIRHSLFMALKETLNNVVRHANASEVTISIRADNTEFVMTIMDNGSGTIPEGDVPGRDGIRGTLERLQKNGGTCERISTPGKGTTVILRLPLT